MSVPLRVLFVEDSEDDCALLLRELNRGGYDSQPIRVETADAFRTALNDEEWDLVISDYSMPRFNGMQALAIHHEIAADVPFILVSGTVGEDIAVESIKAGASDYLMKGNLIRFVPAVNRAMREAAERRTHRRALVSLRESQGMLSLIYNATPDKLVLFSALPDDSYRITSTNRKFLDFVEQTLGPTGPATIPGRRLEEMADTVFACTPEATRSLRDRADQAMSEGRPQLFETFFTLPGRRLHAEITFTPVADADAGTRNLLWSCRDISSRKEAQERQQLLESQLQQSRKLEALGQLAGGIAHDFNNLLTGIIGYAELIKASGNARVPEHIEQVLHAANRAKDLVKQILAFSRRETPERKPIYFEPIVREAIQLIRASAPSGIRVEAFIASDLPPLVGDPTQLHQVVINLCTNAVQAMGDQGKLSLSLETVVVDSGFARNHPPLSEGEFIRLSVGDTGTGIESTAMEHLFEPFFTTKPTGSGTGLGLAVVHGVVRGHDGTISVDSRTGEGTMFQVYFPVSGSIPDSRVAERPDVPQGNGEAVLFVDDEAGIVSLATAVLEQIGYMPVSFTDPVKAFDAFQNEPDRFKAVITDLTMPKMTGTELAQALHRLRPNLPVILTSGYSGAIDGDQAARSGFAEILGKPFALRTLAEALQRALR